MTNPPPDDQSLLARVQRLEQNLFGDLLDEDDSTRIKSEEYSWLYRPSHHVETGLITEADIASLSQPGKRILSVGAHPAYLERILCELGVPSENILIADKDAAINGTAGIPSAHFDMLQEWPADLGMFDLIVFPESICIALTNAIEALGPLGGERFAKDAVESSLLGTLLTQVLEHLKPDGEMRANGPQSHPNVVNTTLSQLRKEENVPCALDYKRYFITVRHG